MILGCSLMHPTLPGRAPSRGILAHFGRKSTPSGPVCPEWTGRADRGTRQNRIVQPFTIDIPQSDLDDLRDRLVRTRRTPRITDDWQRGVQTAALERLLEHWAGPFLQDGGWRAVERRWNAHEHVRVPLRTASGGEFTLHALRAGTRGATPLLLLHGWPDGFWRFEDALPLLADRFELVVPSLPGYGFSDRPAEATGPAAVGDLLVQLMAALGHERFGVHGGDIGSTIGEQLALRHPSSVIGLHLGDAPLHRLRGLRPDDLTDDDREWLARLAVWERDEAAYSRLQRTKPQTLAWALDDSPAALAAWQLEKFHGWSESLDPVTLAPFGLDALCANLTAYWVTRTGGSSGHYYYDNGHSELGTGYVDVPTAFAQFPHDILPGPRASVERWFDVRHWTTFERGGHFGPWEQPEPWAADVRAFFDQL